MHNEILLNNEYQSIDDNAGNGDENECNVELIGSVVKSRYTDEVIENNQIILLDNREESQSFSDTNENYSRYDRYSRGDDDPCLKLTFSREGDISHNSCDQINRKLEGECIREFSSEKIVNNLIEENEGRIANEENISLLRDDNQEQIDANRLLELQQDLNVKKEESIGNIELNQDKQLSYETIENQASAKDEIKGLGHAIKEFPGEIASGRSYNNMNTQYVIYEEENETMTADNNTAKTKNQNSSVDSCINKRINNLISPSNNILDEPIVFNYPNEFQIETLTITDIMDNNDNIEEKDHTVSDPTNSPKDSNQSNIPIESDVLEVIIQNKAKVIPNKINGDIMQSQGKNHAINRTSDVIRETQDENCESDESGDEHNQTTNKDAKVKKKSNTPNKNLVSNNNTKNLKNKHIGETVRYKPSMNNSTDKRPGCKPSYISVKKPIDKPNNSLQTSHPLKQKKKGKSSSVENTYQTKDIKRAKGDNPVKEKKKLTTKESFNIINNLYQSNATKQRKILNLQKEISEKENKEFENQCTFKPKINKEKHMLNEIYGSNSDFTLRQKIWLDKAKEKLDKEKETVYHIEKTNCTFQPNISRDIPEYQEQYIKGTKGYYERIARMNKLNEELNSKKNPDFVQKYDINYKKKERKVCKENLNINQFKNALRSLHTELLNDDE